jgi:hypothetical protein
MKETVIDWAFRWEARNAYRILMRKFLEKQPMENQGDQRIILKWILGK